MSDSVLGRRDAPKEISTPFTVIAEEPRNTEEKATTATKLEPEDSEADQSEDTADEKDLLTSFVPLLISMNILGIGLSLPEEYSVRDIKKRKPCPLTLYCVWKLLVASVMLTYVGYFVAREMTEITNKRRWVVSLDAVSNVITMVSALVVQASMHKASDTLGRMLQKLGEDTDMDFAGRVRETEGPPLAPRTPSSSGSKIFFVTFGTWAMQGLTVVSKLARCYSQPPAGQTDSAIDGGAGTVDAADCLRGNGTLCSSPTAVVNFTEVAVRYGLLRGTVWMSMLLAYYSLVSIEARLKNLNVDLFLLPPPKLGSEALRTFRRTHSVLCRTLKVVDASFSVCSIAWYAHCMVETLASVDQFIAFGPGDLWCLPFRVSVALNAVCLLALMLGTSEAAHSASKKARDSVIVLAQRSAEMPIHQPDMYEEINATLNSFRRDAVTLHCCRVWPLNRASGLLAFLVTMAGVAVLAQHRPASREFLRPHFAL
ncbi:hypothetical protein V5799_005905 [Amblyomma americanum]|uniref:Uncharacterized protein n=1 Tax=Amblyomma americanum TaxID=6943 RepID=A0AAQ4DXX3_AMBAM